MEKYKLLSCLLFLLFCGGLSFFSSCEKVIDLELNEADPKIVIEGSITDQPGPNIIKLTQTVNYDEPNTFPFVSGALVTLKDNVGNTETLKETLPGIYSTDTIQGVSGRTYTLNVTVGENTYTAISAIPQPVIIDTLLVMEVNNPHGSEKIIQAQYADSRDIANFYRFILFRNNIEELIFITDDRLQDGKVISYPLFNPPTQQVSLRTGDSIEVHLQAIDKSLYEYFRTLNQLNSGGSHEGSASLPANPLTNISNGALGYFNACTVRSKTIVVP